MKTLIQLIKDDVSKFLKDNDVLFFNERDFQMNLCMMLMNSDNQYDKIYLEYHIPSTCLAEKDKTNEYIWNSDLRLDVVVQKGDEFCPIELKYKTKSENELLIRRFDQEFLSDVLKNQSAEDLGMYHFWKDVRRIELVRRRFEKVKNGLAIFLTNNPRYTKRGREDSKHINFSMDDTKLQPKEKVWQTKPGSVSKNKKLLENQYPGFSVEKEYQIEWNKNELLCDGADHKLLKITFHYCILEI